MRLIEIIELLKEYVLLGIIAGILFIIGYKIIYQKLMKKNRKISKYRFVLYGISICYIVVLIGATFLNRGSYFGMANMYLFSSYREAYNQMQISLFRNIILNILLFVPLGFLLPLYSNRMKKWYIVIPLGFFVTLLIEILQYITKIGVFEIDDIFNNTLGSIIGFCIFMIVNCLWNKENRKMIIIYILPIIITISVFLGIYIKYESQEFGNLPFEYDYIVNMKNVNIENNIDLSNDRSNQNIYYTKILTENETKEIAKDIFEKLGTSINEDRTIIYEDEAIYYSNTEHILWIKYKGGTYNYTNFEIYGAKSSNDNINEDKSQEVSTVESNDKLKKIQGASSDEMRMALSKIGIDAPKVAEFRENDKGEYIFSVDMYIQDNCLIDGEIKFMYYQNNIISDLRNSLVKYEKVKEKEIISEEEAYKKILQGKFAYDDYNIKKLESIIIEGVNLEYFLDTKGYYVPVYVFEANINGDRKTINIDAIKLSIR